MSHVTHGALWTHATRQLKAEDGARQHPSAALKDAEAQVSLCAIARGRAPVKGVVWGGGWESSDCYNDRHFQIYDSAL